MDSAATDPTHVDAGAVRHVEIVRVRADHSRQSDIDAVAVEEPLEIQLGLWDGDRLDARSISITMRTPGHDEDLAAGFLFTEGIVQSPDQVREIRHCGSYDAPLNVIRVELRPDVAVDLARLQRHFYTTSSCGVCGKSSLDALATGARRLEAAHAPAVSPQVVDSLPGRLRDRQRTFAHTGGLHAAALFTHTGELLDLREDVGRHNAVDKVLGARFMAGRIDNDEQTILFLSGRASFELLQKAVMGRIPVVCAVGAPSSLAVRAARDFGVTLLGFVRDGRFNVYTGSERIVPV